MLWSGGIAPGQASNQFHPWAGQQNKCLRVGDVALDAQHFAKDYPRSAEWSPSRPPVALSVAGGVPGVPQVPGSLVGQGAMCLVRGHRRVAGAPGDGALTTALVAERRLARRQANALEILSRRVRRGPPKKQLRLLRERIRRYNGKMAAFCKTLSDWMLACSVALRLLEDRVRRQDAWIAEQRRKGGVLGQLPPLPSSPPCLSVCPGGPWRPRADSVPGVPCSCGRGLRSEASSPLPPFHEMLHCHSYLPCMMETMAGAWCMAPARLHRVVRPPSFYWERLDPKTVDAAARTMGVQIGTVERGCNL